MSQISSISTIKMDFHCKTLRMIIVIVLQRLSYDHTVRLWVQIRFTDTSFVTINYHDTIRISLQNISNNYGLRLQWFFIIIKYKRQLLQNVRIERFEATGCYGDKSANLILKWILRIFAVRQIRTLLRNCNCSDRLLSWGWNFTAKLQHLETVAVTSCCSKLRKLMLQNFAIKIANLCSHCLSAQLGLSL